MRRSVQNLRWTAIERIRVEEHEPRQGFGYTICVLELRSSAVQSLSKTSPEGNALHWLTPENWGGPHLPNDEGYQTVDGLRVDELITAYHEYQTAY